MPQFSYSLISVSCLLQNKDICLKFSDDHCVIQGKSPLKMIGRANCEQGLYLLRSTHVDSSRPVVTCFVSSNVWHTRLGHLSSKRLLSMKSVLGIPNTHVSPCYICPFAKQRRLSFPFNNNVASAVFDIVHCDIWGPFKVSTYTGYQYFITIVNDCSRYTWTYLMRSKSDALLVVPRFFKSVETHFNKTIKIFRSDNAPELLFTDFFATTWDYASIYLC